MKYHESGVNIDAATRALAKAKAEVRSTWDERVRSDLGAFGGLYRAAPGQPLLVASVDGVGTKVKVAAATGRYDTVGQDLVNHCVDDILVQGADPLFFLDYFATGALRDGVLEAVLKGFAKACRENGCALLGGETAEMPGVYADRDFDLAGCIVGQVEERHLIDGSAVQAGDIVWGLPSTGLHTNGYSLARRVLLEGDGPGLDADPDGLDGTIADALLAVHRSYLGDMRRIWDACGRDPIHGLAHITGGGFYDNIPRIMPGGLCAEIHTDRWTVPRIFSLIGEIGRVEAKEMYRVFNMGIGFVVIAAASTDLGSVEGLGAIEIGRIREDADAVDVIL